MNQRELTPKVSVIVPVHNTEDYLKSCLDSLVSQTMKDIEIICVDDCSTDESATIIKRYMQQDSRVRGIFHDRNVSASQCRKDGVLASTGKYVMFVDADDFLESNACEVAWKEIARRGVDILQFDAVVENCANLPEWRIESNQKSLKPYLEDDLGEDLLQACFIDFKISVNVWNKIVRGSVCRAALAKVEDGFFPKANDLYAVFFLMEEAKSFAGLDVPLYHYCFGRGMTGQNVMTLSQFTLHCKGALVIDALRRYVDASAPERREDLQPIVDQIAKRLLNEQCGRWYSNLEKDERIRGFDVMCESWNRGRNYIIAGLANKYYYSRSDIAQYLMKAPCLVHHPRKVRTVALYYRCIYNGGAQRVVAQICNILATMREQGKEKYRVILVTDEPPCEEDYELLPGIERYQIPAQENFPKEDFYTRAQAWESFLNKYHVDVFVNSMWVSPTTLWDMLCIKSHASHPAYFIHCHSCCGMIYRMENDIVKESHYSFALADGIVTLSRSDREYWSLVNSNVYYIPNPCHVQAKEKTRSRYESKSVLWLGRISYEKQPREMIQIMRHVVREVPDAVCHVVGSGSEALMEMLQKDVIDCGLEKNIIFDGFQIDVTQYYQNASVFLMTSSYEGFPLTLYESAAHGLPTVMYKLPWLEYNSDISGGTSVAQQDAAGAAEAIVKLLTDADHWKSCSDQTYDSFKKYAEKDVGEKWVEMFKNLEKQVLPQLPETPMYEKIILDQIIQFQSEGTKQRRNKINTLQKKLQKTYDEKAERGIQIKQLKNSKAYRLGMLILGPLYKLQWFLICRGIIKKDPE